MAKVLSSISGNLISAASAGFAPTNSADVSAIASAYQVVSATGTQLYVGTAYVTSVNSTPLSASRAGNAANASLATSAYYDGTGRLISSLPDSATVSSIASSYAESAASGKLDTTAQVVSATAGDGTYITSINGMGLSGQGGGGGGGDAFPADIVTAGNVRAVVTTGFQDNTATRPTLFISSNPAYNSYPRMMLSENHETTGKSGAFLADAFEFYTGTGIKVFRADPTAISALKFFLGSAKVEGNNWNLASGSVSGGNTTSNWFLNRNWVSGISGTATWQYGTAEYNKLTSVHDTVSANSASWGGGGGGSYVETSAMEVEIGSSNTASSIGFAQGSSNSARNTAFAQGRGNNIAYTSFGQGALNAAYSCSLAQGTNNTADIFSLAQGELNRVSSTSFSQGSYNTAGSTSFAQGNGNVASSCSFAQGIINTAYDTSFTHGYGNSAINKAVVFGEYNLSGDGDTASGNSAAFAIGDGTAHNARHDLMLVTKDGEITMYSSTADTTGTGIMSAIRAISAAATGGVDSATVSAIASGYASGKADSSSLSSYALSADVSGTVDVVSTQSANWGGSALALSAGPGVKLEQVGNTLVASVDGPLHRQETLAGYWNGSAVYQQFISGTATSNGNTNFSIPAEITKTNIVNKWIDPSNSFIYYNTTSNALPLSWCLGSGRYGSVGFVGGVINYRCIDTAPAPITAYIALKYMKA